jgi:hypothetical protein
VRWLGTDEVSESRGECGGDGLLEADTVLARTRRRGWPLFIVVHCVEATRAAPRERKDTRWLDTEAERACPRGAEAHRQKGPPEGHVSCICPYVGVGVVS